ncbi:UNVERIFIED_CONTAM: hypothetical protein GTU68_023041 [Idotea baltica]|nr:hypothetical protein [Idotea baltica]
MADFLGGWEPESVEFCLDHFLSESSIRPFTERLALGALKNRLAIDSELTCASENWSISRMGRVDRAILRIAAYEILFLEDIPNNVSINEAIEIAKRYGADESPQFVNGVLDKIARAVAKPLAEEVSVVEEKPERSDTEATADSDVDIDSLVNELL